MVKSFEIVVNSDSTYPISSLSLCTGWESHPFPVTSHLPSPDGHTEERVSIVVAELAQQVSAATVVTKVNLNSSTCYKVVCLDPGSCRRRVKNLHPPLPPSPPSPDRVDARTSPV